MADVAGDLKNDALTDVGFDLLMYGVTTDSAGNAIAARGSYSRIDVGTSTTVVPVSTTNPLPIILPSATVTTLTPPAAITGFATAVKQDTGNTSLASIDTKITAVNTGAVVVSSSALPSGASTVAAQSTGNTSLATLAGAVAGTEMQVDVLTMPTVTVTGTLTDAQLRASAVPVSAAQTGTWTVQPGNTANTTAWLVTGTGGTFPITVASLPLPSGAASAANQSTEITHLAAIATKAVDFDSGAGTDTVVGFGLMLPASGGAVIGGTSTNPIRVDVTGSTTQPVSGTFWQATQPVSGTVTANAGTNLNTSALAVESGGNVAATATSLAIIDDWDESDRAKVNLIAGQVGVTGGAGAVAANTPRITHASDDPVTASLVSIDTKVGTAVEIIDDWNESARAKVNLIVGQAGVSGNTGTVDATTQRVVLATDVALPTGTNSIGNLGTVTTVTTVGAVTAITNALPAGANAIGKLAANSGVDIGDVDVTSIAAGDNNIGNVDIVTVPSDPFGVNADAASATGSISAKLRFIASTGIPVTNTVTVATHAVTATDLDIRDLVVGDVVSAEPDGTALSNNQVSVDTTAGGVEIVAASAGRQGVIVTNQGAIACYVGTGTVSTSNGFLLNPGESLPMPTDSSVKAICGSSSTTVGFLAFA